jgi:hypothetical protein
MDVEILGDEAVIARSRIDRVHICISEDMVGTSVDQRLMAHTMAGMDAFLHLVAGLNKL